MSARSTESRLREIQIQMEQQQTMMLNEVHQIAQRLEAMAEQQVCCEQLQTMDMQINLIKAHQERLTEELTLLAKTVESGNGHLCEQLNETVAVVHEIRTGDVFRRIEFMQGKMVLLENTLQRNLLNMEDQKRSEEYGFITRKERYFQCSR